MKVSTIAPMFSDSTPHSRVDANPPRNQNTKITDNDTSDLLPNSPSVGLCFYGQEVHFSVY